jgi:pimeloyl-ACP methyl ester carboxylesterase
MFGKPSWGVAATVALSAAVAVASPSLVAASATPPAAVSGAAADEAQRVDRVPTPKLVWSVCYKIAECAKAKVPLDYDEPKGPSTTLALLRVKAKDQKGKIGSLFLNPGGPGGSGTEIALAARHFLGKAVLAKFDVVGIDPRGIGGSDQLRCFSSTRAQQAALKGYAVGLPYGAEEEAAYVKSAKALGVGCSTTGKKIAGAMSTAEVARDMDLMRRAVGDKKLTYLGFSYGTALGQYYANMFPGRVRSVVVDGVINPRTWVGDKKTAGIPQDDRLRSGDGAYKAFKEIMARCDKAGPVKCRFGDGKALATFGQVAERLKKKPVHTPAGDLTYGSLVGSLLSSLYQPQGWQDVISISIEAKQATDPASSRADQEAALRTILAHRRAPAAGYDNSAETYSGVACTDGLHPADAALWPNLMVASEKRAPYFGPAWGYGTTGCGASTWTVRDEDAYRGPFDIKTAAPVLFVGNYWDPATNYDESVAASGGLPGSRLISSDSWGHTAYGTSTCVTSAVDAYLLKGTLPKSGIVCKGDEQPFGKATGQARERPEPMTKEQLAAQDGHQSSDPLQLPPVVEPGLPYRPLPR